VSASPGSPALWPDLFGNDDPVEIEIGCGDGAFLAAAAARRPRVNFLGLETQRPRVRRAEERLATAGGRVRVLRADATCVVTALVAPASVHAYHVYFPDPWPKHRHAKRRLFTPRLITAMARTLVPGGRLLVATDIHGYGWLIRGRILDSGAFVEIPVDPDHGGLTTAFARKYRARGRLVYSAAFRTRSL
jgi:tRNA (guanine-N7-)-methyltransferase